MKLCFDRLEETSAYQTRHRPCSIVQNWIRRDCHTHTQTSTYFRSPFSITTVKSAHRAKICWYRRRLRLIYQYQITENYNDKCNKRMDRSNSLFYINTKWQIPVQIPVPYGCKLRIPPTNYHLLAAQQEPYKNPKS